jgi:hypothetical protein
MHHHNQGDDEDIVDNRVRKGADLESRGDSLSN